MVRDSNTSMSITVEIRNTFNISIQGTVSNVTAYGVNDGSIDVQLSGLSGTLILTGLPITDPIQTMAH